jgi:hypothetical protein
MLLLESENKGIAVENRSHPRRRHLTVLTLTFTPVCAAEHRSRVAFSLPTFSWRDTRK